MLNNRWLVRPSDSTDRWCVMLTTENIIIADLLSEEHAKHIVELHNRWVSINNFGLSAKKFIEEINKIGLDFDSKLNKISGDL